MTSHDGPVRGRNGERKSVATRFCAACGQALTGGGPGRPRQFCSAACRKLAFRRRHPASASARPSPLPAGRSRRALTIYECPGCGERYLGDQRCPECHLFCHRVDFGGACYGCDQLITVSELLGS